MRAGGTRITPWLMLRTGFRCRRASATLVLWFWYALTCGWCGLRRFVVFMVWELLGADTLLVGGVAAGLCCVVLALKVGA